MGVDNLKLESFHPLVIDVSSTVIQIGIPNKNNWNELCISEKQAMDGLFQCVDQLDINLRKVDGLFFCAGPGSTLGLRLALAFAKTLQWVRKNELKLFSYNALDLACKMSDKPPPFLQAPFRMGWRLVRSSPNQKPIGKKEIFESEEALKKFPDSMHLKDSRTKFPSIDSEKIIEYDLKKISGLQDLLSISEPVNELKIYSPRPPEFKKWNPQIKFLSSQ